MGALHVMGALVDLARSTVYNQPHQLTTLEKQMQVDCPCCGSKLEVTVSALSLSDSESRPAQSQYAARLDPVPPKAAPIPTPPPKKYRTNTDAGAFRQALADAGFVKQAEDGTIFNDKNVNSRRLKLWFGRAVCDATGEQKEALGNALKKHFGDRLLDHGPHSSFCWRGVTMSYVVNLSL